MKEGILYAQLSIDIKLRVCVWMIYLSSYQAGVKREKTVTLKTLIMALAICMNSSMYQVKLKMCTKITFLKCFLNVNFSRPLW